MTGGNEIRSFVSGDRRKRYSVVSDDRRKRNRQSNAAPLSRTHSRRSSSGSSNFDVCNVDPDLLEDLPFHCFDRGLSVRHVAAWTVELLPADAPFFSISNTSLPTTR